MAQLSRREPFIPPEPTRTVVAQAVGWAPALQAVLRIGTGLLFLQHGLQKMFGLLGGKAVPVASLLGVAGILELVGGLLLVVGLFTRPVAAILALEMVAAMVIAHFPRGGWPIQNGAELPMLYALIFAFFAASGAGPASADTAFTSYRVRPARIEPSV
jgi:putative oxidoreductase